jgi:hypothetical protein
MTMNDGEMIQFLTVRELVRTLAEVVKATGLPQFHIANEMMVQAIMMVLPSLDIEAARAGSAQFWATVLAELQKAADATAPPAPADTPAPQDNVVNFRGLPPMMEQTNAINP